MNKPLTNYDLPTPGIKPFGRPTEYHPSFCDMVIEFMAEGHSIGAFAHKIKVPEKRVRAWLKQYPEFGDAVDLGRCGRVSMLEDVMNLRGKALTAPLATLTWKTLTNIAPDDYRDKVTIEGEGGSLGNTALKQIAESIAAIGDSVASRLGGTKQLIHNSVIDAEFSEVESVQLNNPHTDVQTTDNNVPCTDDSVSTTKKADGESAS